jgi:surface antigen
MAARGLMLVMASIAIPLVAGCQTNEQTGGLVGGGIGALACGAAGAALFHRSYGAILPAAACGAAGYFIGSAIGRQLDERDRAVAAVATQEVLAMPVSYRATGSAPYHPPARTVRWKSDHSGTHGSATVVAVQPSRNGGECRTVREIAYIRGEEVPQTTRYCRPAEGGSWAAQA